MALNIKNPEVEKLATEVARMANETKTEAIRRALEDRKALLETRETLEEKRKRIMHYMETEVWPNIPPELLGKTITKEEREEMLGYGPDGV
jgi:antitoxin VapB